MEEGSDEVGRVGVAAGAEVGCRNGNTGAHHGRCTGAAGWVGAEEKEKGKEKGVEMEAEEMETEEIEEAEETGAGTERDGHGDMEVEETLKSAEKSVDEVERVEKDVMEE